MKDMTIQIVLVDDEEDFLENTQDGLKYHKGSNYVFNVVATARSGEEGIALIEKHHPDIAVMDIKMPPGIDGIEAARHLHKTVPETRVLIFSSYKDFSDMETIVNAGVRGYIPKGSIKELIKGIISVWEGEPYFPQEIVASLFRKQFSKEDPGISLNAYQLTPREKEIVLLHRQGLSKQEICDTLKISISSVRTYFRRIEQRNGFKV